MCWLFLLFYILGLLFLFYIGIMSKTTHRTSLVWQCHQKTRRALPNDGILILAGHMSPHSTSHFFPDAPNLSPALACCTASGEARQAEAQPCSPTTPTPQQNSHCCCPGRDFGCEPVIFSCLGKGCLIMGHRRDTVGSVISIPKLSVHSNSHYSSESDISGQLLCVSVARALEGWGWL